MLIFFYSIVYAIYCPSHKIITGSVKVESDGILIGATKVDFRFFYLKTLYFLGSLNQPAFLATLLNSGKVL